MFQALAIFIFFLGAAPLTAEPAKFDVLQFAAGVWELDAEETEDRGKFLCSDSPESIRIDAKERRFYATREGQSFVADILEVGQNYFWIRYLDEDRLDDQGKPVEWAFVAEPPDRFSWERRDWQADDGTTSRTAYRKRCSG